MKERSELFNSLHTLLLEQNKIEVSVSQELEIWNDADDVIHGMAVNDFFLKFIHVYGIFHDLLGESNAHGDNHELKLSIVDGNILMEGITGNESDLYLEGDEEDLEKLEEISFKWIFDKKGNLLSFSE